MTLKLKIKVGSIERSQTLFVNAVSIILREEGEPKKEITQLFSFNYVPSALHIINNISKVFPVYQPRKDQFYKLHLLCYLCSVYAFYSEKQKTNSLLKRLNPIFRTLHLQIEEITLNGNLCSRKKLVDGKSQVRLLWTTLLSKNLIKTIYRS